MVELPDGAELVLRLVILFEVVIESQQAVLVSLDPVAQVIPSSLYVDAISVPSGVKPNSEVVLTTDHVKSGVLALAGV